MRNLQQLIEERNRFQRLFGNKEFSLPLNQDEINTLALTIDGKMSPENLHCDGEISHSAAMRQARFLRAAFAELHQHAKDQGLEITAEIYEIHHQ